MCGPKGGNGAIFLIARGKDSVRVQFFKIGCVKRLGPGSRRADKILKKVFIDESKKHAGAKPLTKGSHKLPDALCLAKVRRERSVEDSFNYVVTLVTVVTLSR